MTRHPAPGGAEHRVAQLQHLLNETRADCSHLYRTLHAILDEVTCAACGHLGRGHYLEADLCDRCLRDQGPAAAYPEIDPRHLFEVSIPSEQVVSAGPRQTESDDVADARRLRGLLERIAATYDVMCLGDDPSCEKCIVRAEIDREVGIPPSVDPEARERKEEPS